MKMTMADARRLRLISARATAMIRARVTEG
jgi:hypothetical protein